MKFITINKIHILFFFMILLFTIIFPISLHANKKQEIKQEEGKISENSNLQQITKPKKDSFDSYLISQYKKKKLIALTFDDGPSIHTTTLIDGLNKRNVVATFFVLGENVEKYPDTLKFQYDCGHEISIHSYTHKLFTKLQKEEIEEQILKTHEIIYNITGHKASFIRVPYGSRNEKIDEVLYQLKLTDILWTIDSLDWKLQNIQKTYEQILKDLKGNDIILMHDTYDTSIKTALKLVDKLLDDNYTFVTVGKLIEIVYQVDGSIQNNDLLKQKIF